MAPVNNKTRRTIKFRQLLDNVNLLSTLYAAGSGETLWAEEQAELERIELSADYFLFLNASFSSV